MKKHITLAALLSAGAAFANAESVTIHDTEFTSPTAQALHSAFSSNTDAANANAYISNLAYYTNGTKGYTYGGFYVKNDGGLKFNHGTNVTVSFLYIDSGISLRPNNTNSLVGQINWSNQTAKLLLSNATDAWVDINANYGTAIDLSNMVAASSIYLNTLGSLATTTSSASIYATALTNLVEIGEHSSIYAYDSETKTVTRTLLSGDYSGWNGTVTLSGVSNYNITNDSNGLKVSYVIPEPSMFGLLAGLGALALVGTRRRRR